MIITPKYKFETVDVDRIILILHRDQGMPITFIAKVIGENKRTIRGWIYDNARPTKLYKLYILIDFACRFIPNKVMNSCGVYELTDKNNLNNASAEIRNEIAGK